MQVQAIYLKCNTRKIISCNWIYILKFSFDKGRTNDSFWLTDFIESKGKKPNPPKKVSKDDQSMCFVLEISAILLIYKQSEEESYKLKHIVLRLNFHTHPRGRFTVSQDLLHHN